MIVKKKGKSFKSFKSNSCSDFGGSGSSYDGYNGGYNGGYDGGMVGGSGPKISPSNSAAYRNRFGKAKSSKISKGTKVYSAITAPAVLLAAAPKALIKSGFALGTGALRLTGRTAKTAFDLGKTGYSGIRARSARHNLAKSLGLRKSRRFSRQDNTVYNSFSKSAKDYQTKMANFNSQIAKETNAGKKATIRQQQLNYTIDQGDFHTKRSALADEIHRKLGYDNSVITKDDISALLTTTSKKLHRTNISNRLSQLISNKRKEAQEKLKHNASNTIALKTLNYTSRANNLAKQSNQRKANYIKSKETLKSDGRQFKKIALNTAKTIGTSFTDSYKSIRDAKGLSVFYKPFTGIVSGLTEGMSKSISKLTPSIQRALSMTSSGEIIHNMDKSAKKIEILNNKINKETKDYNDNTLHLKSKIEENTNIEEKAVEQETYNTFNKLQTLQAQQAKLFNDYTTTINSTVSSLEKRRAKEDYNRQLLETENEIRLQQAKFDEQNDKLKPDSRNYNDLTKLFKQGKDIYSLNLVAQKQFKIFQIGNDLLNKNNKVSFDYITKTTISDDEIKSLKIKGLAANDISIITDKNKNFDAINIDKYITLIGTLQDKIATEASSTSISAATEKYGPLLKLLKAKADIYINNIVSPTNPIEKITPIAGFEKSAFEVPETLPKK